MYLLARSNLPAFAASAASLNRISILSLAIDCCHSGLTLLSVFIAKDILLIFLNMFMESSYAELLAKAKKEIEIADHLIYVTFKMVSEVKILLAISEHIYNATRAALQALLTYEHTFKRIEAYPPNFVAELSIYRNRDVEKRYGFDPKFFRLMHKLLEMNRIDKASIMRFKRGNNYILSTGDYEMTVLDVESIKRYKYLSQRFIESVSAVIQKPAQPK